MKKFSLFFITCLFAFGCNKGVSYLEVTRLTCENLSHPMGIESPSPRLSWNIISKKNGTSQSSYQILVADDERLLKKNEGNIWNSGKVESGQSIMVTYTGATLEAGKKYWWKVKIWDELGQESRWSEAASWQMGLLTSSDWNDAHWIGYEDMADSMRVVPGVHGSGNNLGEKGKQRPVVPLFRKSFDLKKKVSSATLFISGLGQYEAYINGEKIGDSFLAPGWSEYDKTVLYNIYDVTELLKSGENVIGAIVGNGFYNINRERYRKLVIAYGMPKMICKLAVTFKDGTQDVIVSGSDWKTSPSPVVFTSIYGGEDYDARLEQPGWNSAGFDDASWKEALLVQTPQGHLKAEVGHPVKVNETFSPVNVNKLEEGGYVYDFGQNASGIIELTVKGKKGQEVRLKPAELINAEGKANQKATGSYHFSYILKGDGEEVWRPRFSYYGFRYVQVDGAVPQSDTSSVDLPCIIGLKSLHTGNSSPVVGSFNCSNELFNRIVTLINWSIKSNLQSVMTDCPHREKLGWIEQTHLMGQGIQYNFDIYHTYQKLVQDMIDAQLEDGLVPNIAPEYVNFGDYMYDFRDSPEWGSASVLIPWMIYQWYGDKSVLEKAWPMMDSYVEYLNLKSDKLIVAHGLGDWYDLGPERPGFVQLTPRELTATAYFYYDVEILAKIAAVLGKSDEQQNYIKLASEIKDSFNKHFYDAETKVYATGSQTSMAIPLCMGFVDEADRSQVLANMVDSIRNNNNALTAGDIGFHFLVEALTRGGESELLYQMNNRDDVPGYGFQLKKGATALTESWQALESVSNNHLMLGHIMEWFYSGIGGIRQDETAPAYKSIIISPEVVGDLTHAETSFLSPYGEIKTSWEKSEAEFTLKVKIPANTNAKIFMPFKGDVSVSELLEASKEIESIKKTGDIDGRIIYQIGSGEYTFTVKNIR